MDIRLENEIPLPAPEQYRILFTSEFIAFLAQEYGLCANMAVEEKSSVNPILGLVRIIPSLDLSNMGQGIPSKTFVSHEIVNQQHHIKNPERFELHWGFDLPVLKKKFQASGILHLIPVNESSCLLILKGKIHIRFFGIGGLLERKFMKRVKRGVDQFPRLVEKWKSISA